MESIIPETVHAGLLGRKVDIPNAEQWGLTSRVERRSYRIMIGHPIGDPPPGGYPVIYLLDGNSVFGTMVEALRLQCRRPDVSGGHACDYRRNWIRDRRSIYTRTLL